MKFSKVEVGVALTRPLTLMEALMAIKVTPSAGATATELINLVGEHGYKPVEPTAPPAIPAALMGRCVVRLGVPTVNPDGTLTRTYEFSEATESELVAATRINRNKRDRLLAENVDSINAVRWAAMTAGEQAKWTAYRQALLDFPEQPGFPMNATWPVKPT